MINGKTIMMNVDFYDQCYWADMRNQGLYDEKRIENLVRQCRDQGVDILFWRLTVCGKTAYPSKVETVFDGYFDKHSKALVNVLKKFDPLEVGSKYARKYGIKIYPWIDLYDKYFLSMQGRLVKEHPEYQWVDRSGMIYLKGVPCYAYPEVRASELRFIKEVLSYDVDGLLLTTASHCDQNCPYRVVDMFGYNQPIVKEYKRRYGVDISRFDNITYERNDAHFITKFNFIGNDFDLDLWHRLKGEYFTLFLKQVRQALGKKRKMIVAVNNRTEGVRPMARHHMNWGQWAQKGIIDGLILCEYSKLKGRGFLDNPLIDSLKRQLSGKPLYIWHWVPANRQGWKNIGYLSRRAARLDKNDLLDGFTFHEAGTFEFGSN